MENSGTAGATSFGNSRGRARYAPRYAFENSGNKWLSNLAQQSGSGIWMNFATPHRLAQLGFTTVYNKHAPRRFDIVGSPNCAAPWTVLLHVADAGWPNDWESGLSKNWTVAPQKRRAFRCIGLMVETTWDMFHVLVKNIQMWEEAE